MREQLLKKIGSYCKGLINSPDEETRLAATIERRLTEIYTYRSASTDTETPEEGQKID